MFRTILAWSAGALLALVLGAIALLVVLALAAMHVFGWSWFSNATANTRGHASQINQVNGNGSYRIAAYDHFFDLCAAVQTDESSIDNLADELKQQGLDPQRKLVVQASITALRNNRAEKINQYNVDSQKAGTVGQFKASDLPYVIDIHEKETSCHA